MRKVRLPELEVGSYKLKVLDFDIESRPLGWYGGDFTHQEVTAISSAWVDDPVDSMEVLTISKRAGSEKRMLKKFRKRFDEADMLVGHYIRGFDLPQINAAMLEFGLPGLSDILTHDTKNDLTKFQGVSKSQKNLGALLGIEAPKVDMSVPDWREANRLSRDGIAKTKIRVVGDVLQNIEMYKELKRRGFLTKPKLWTPGGSGFKRYRP